MNKPVDGGRAFPFEFPMLDSAGLIHEVTNPGMTMRQWYAGMALVGLLSRDPALSSDFPSDWPRCAREAMLIADAMIAQDELHAAKHTTR